MYHHHTTNHHTTNHHQSHHRRGQRWMLAGAATIMLLGASCTSGADHRQAADSDTFSFAGAEPDPTSVPSVDDSTSNMNSGTTGGHTNPGATNQSNTGGGSNGGQSTSPEIDDPCSLNDFADGSSLIVGPDPLTLGEGVYTGTVSILNCSDGDVDWTAATVPSVSLDDDGAKLLPGEYAELDFEIDTDAWEPGPIEFKIKVSEPGFNYYVDVEGYRTLTGQDVTLDLDHTAGEGAGNCANNCIVSALINSSPSTPDVTLDVTLTLPALAEVWVSTEPFDEVDGEVAPPASEPIATSGELVTEWTGQLSPLESDTDYHILLGATDPDGNTWYEQGAFTTVLVIGGLSNAGGAGGCSSECVQSALVSNGGAWNSKHFEVTSHTVANYVVYVSTTPPADQDGVLQPPTEGVVYSTSSDGYATAWSTSFDGLEADTDYHILLIATDAEGLVDRRHGEFGTGSAPRVDLGVELVGVRVHDAGDADGTGEIIFSWKQGNELLMNSSGEIAVTHGGWATLGWSYQLDDFPVDGFAPVLQIGAAEQDGADDGAFCEPSAWTIYEVDFWGTDHECGDSWSNANGIFSYDGLPDCADVGLDSHAGSRCVEIYTYDRPQGIPEYTAYVALTELS